MKGAFHLHTSYSYDCLTSPKSIVKKALSAGLDAIVIADHDTLQGSIAAKKIADSLGLKIEVPIAGEFLTDIGDVIVMDVPENFIPSFDHRELSARAKKQGGYTVLPHPYDAHALDRIAFDLIDCIEIFNSRSSPENDRKAKELAERLNKPILYGADAHFLTDMLNASFEYEGSLSLPSFITPIQLIKTQGHRKALSQSIKGLKQRDLKLFLRSGVRAAKAVFSRDKFF